MQKREAARDKLLQKYSRADQESKRSNAGMVECIDNVKEVGLSCERKIKELKVYTASIANIEILLNAILALFCMGGSKERQSQL